MTTILGVKILQQANGLELSIIGYNNLQLYKQITTISNNTCLFNYTTTSLAILAVFWLLEIKIDRILPMHHM
jgi:hypothetical protein